MIVGAQGTRVSRNACCDPDVADASCVRSFANRFPPP